MTSEESEPDARLVEYAFDMINRSKEYDNSIHDYDCVLQEDNGLEREIEAVIEEEVDKVFCGACGADKLFNTVENAYYCPVCD